MDEGGSLVFGLVLILAAVLFYFLPALVADMRGRDGSTMIAIANVLIGWTVIGWLVLLIIAFTGESKGARKHREEELELLRKLAAQGAAANARDG